MRERIEPVSRVICVGLGLLLVFELVRAVVRPNPFGHLTIPAVPTLSAASDEGPPGKPTNAPSVGGVIPPGTPPPTQATNPLAGGVATNVAAQSPSNATNAPAVTVAAGSPQPAGATNAAPGAVATNAPSPSMATNAPTGAVAIARGPQPPSKATNAPPGPMAMAGAPPGIHRGPGPMPGGPNRPGGPPGMGGPPLPPAAQARVDRIVQSEIFGAVPKPPPMALLGIAGGDAFLRGPNGQTGLVKEGGELGGLKLLKIGTNRVLVEEDGQTKELTVFSGFGSETLLPKGKENPQ